MAELFPKLGAGAAIRELVRAKIEEIETRANAAVPAPTISLEEVADV